MIFTLFLSVSPFLSFAFLPSFFGGLFLCFLLLLFLLFDCFDCLTVSLSSDSLVLP